MSNTLELSLSMALVEAQYLRNIADAIEHLADAVYVKGMTHVQPTTRTDAWPFGQIRITK